MPLIPLIDKTRIVVLGGLVSLVCLVVGRWKPSSSLGHHTTLESSSTSTRQANGRQSESECFLRTVGATKAKLRVKPGS